MRATEAITLAREVINKYGADADKPSVHLAKSLLAGAHERDRLLDEIARLRRLLDDLERRESERDEYSRRRGEE